MPRKKKKGYPEITEWKTQEEIDEQNNHKKAIPIYLNGNINIECRYLKVNKDRKSGIALFKCTNPEVIEETVGMVLTCSGCKFAQTKRSYKINRKGSYKGKQNKIKQEEV